MKELSIEEKAKRYDEAIEKAKYYYDEGKTLEYANDIVSDIFPELKESDDEMIRKAPIHYMKDYSDGTGLIHAVYGVNRNDAIAWLEKQGEKGINGKNREIPFSEQKPAWSEEDEEALRLCLRAIETAFYYKMDYKFQATDWLKSLKDRVQPQPKQEWGEEDEKYLIYNIEQDYKDKLNNNPPESLRPYYNKVISWLKSLRPQKVQKVSKEDLEKMGKQIAEYNKLLEQLRPQKLWKPSDEQIEILDMVLTNESMDDNVVRILRELREQLKKLREG